MKGKYNMKKTIRILSVICLAAMMFMLVACGGDEKPADAGTQTNPGTSVSASGKYVFNYYGTKIAISDEAAPIISAIGEPLNYFEAPSCAFEGIDKTYTYVDVVIITYPDGSTDRISTIRLTADTVSTAEGIAIGSTLDDIVAAYGDGYVQDVNSYTYTDGGTKLMFVLENDAVSSITYALA